MYTILTHKEVKSTDRFCGLELEFDMNTVKPLRMNSPANTWEVGRLFFRYSDTFHYYWLLVKPNGIELVKKDCDSYTHPVNGQKFLVTQSTPTLKMNTCNKIAVDMVGNHNKVFWNGNLVIDYIDKTMSPKLGSGKIAMYWEDAYVLYNNMMFLQSNNTFFYIAPKLKILGIESRDPAHVILLLMLMIVLSFSNTYDI